MAYTREEKAEALLSRMERLREVERDLKRGRVVGSRLDRIRIVVEKEQRRIETGFSVDRVAASLSPDS